MLDVISNPSLNPVQNASSPLDPHVELIQPTLVLLASLDQNVRVVVLEMLEQSSVTSWPGWTSTVWNWDTETEIQPETEGADNMKFISENIMQRLCY